MKTCPTVSRRMSQVLLAIILLSASCYLNKCQLFSCAPFRVLISSDSCSKLGRVCYFFMYLNSSVMQ